MTVPEVRIESLELSSGQTLCQLSLMPGPVDAQCWDALCSALVDTPLSMPVLLISEHATLPRLDAESQRDWIVAAGRYRKAQEEFRHQGGRLISLVTSRLIGGTYLIHGMGASLRLICSDAKVYPALAPDLFEQIFKRPYPHPDSVEKALETGVVTHIVDKDRAFEQLAEILDR